MLTTDRPLPDGELDKARVNIASYAVGPRTAIDTHNKVHKISHSLMRRPLAFRPLLCYNRPERIS